MPEQSSRGERGLRRGPARNAPDPPSLPRLVSLGAPGPAAERQPLPRSAIGLPPLGSDFWSVLDAGLAQLGLALSSGVRAALDSQARLLVAWNQQINLTALREQEQIARGHLLDSLSAVALLRRLGCRRLLDLGSGAGYPGLPLAVGLPVAECALVDSVGKKREFLQVAGEAAEAALEQAGEPAPRIVALGERAEDLAQEADQREAWDVVCARAVGSLAEVLELGLPLVRIGGHVVAWKREGQSGTLGTELRQAQRVLQAAGGSRPKVERVAGLDELGLAGHRLVVVRKRHHTPDRYPRSPAERRRALLT